MAVEESHYDRKKEFTKTIVLILFSFALISVFYLFITSKKALDITFAAIVDVGNATQNSFIAPVFFLVLVTLFSVSALLFSVRKREFFPELKSKIKLKVGKKKFLRDNAEKNETPIRGKLRDIFNLYSKSKIAGGRKISDPPQTNKKIKRNHIKKKRKEIRDKQKQRREERKTTKTAVKIEKNRKTHKISSEERSKTIRKRLTKKISVRKKPVKSKAIKENKLRLTRAEKNPIITPMEENDWESWQTFNPGVVLLDNKVHFLYRAIGKEGISRFGYAVSNDGFTIDERLPFPVYEHNPGQRKFVMCSYGSGGSWGGCEDPRICRVDKENHLYVTYTACDGGLRVGLTSIRVKDFLSKEWNWKAPKLISPPEEVHKNWVIFPEKINGKYAILHSINPEIKIDYVDNLDFPDRSFIKSCYGGGNRKGVRRWDSWVRGVGPTPLKTKEGWLILYHAMDKNDPGKYKVGAMLLDLNNPEKILCRSTAPILEPDEPYENEGFKYGVVYASGAVIKNGTLIVYYGGADNYVCAAFTDIEQFLNSLKKGTIVKLKKKRIKVIKRRKKVDKLVGKRKG